MIFFPVFISDPGPITLTLIPSIDDNVLANAITRFDVAAKPGKGYDVIITIWYTEFF